MKRGLSETCSLFFLTLSNPTRLAIVELLRKGSRNVTEISKALRQDQTMISHNLRPLVRCGFVFVERRWKERVYSLNRETMDGLFNLITSHAEKYCPRKTTCLEAK